MCILKMNTTEVMINDVLYRSQRVADISKKWRLGMAVIVL